MSFAGFSNPIVGTTPYRLFVANANRKRLCLYWQAQPGTGATRCVLGGDNTVTLSNGFSLPVDSNLNSQGMTTLTNYTGAVWVVCDAANGAAVMAFEEG